MKCVIVHSFVVSAGTDLARMGLGLGKLDHIDGDGTLCLL
jgi:hypothetical protein